MREIVQSKYRKLLLLGLLVYILTAVFSIGYFHPDEHFQILEFCQYKLGKSPLSDLPWEYNEHMRPALQPSMVFILIKFLQLFQLQNPFYIASILRLLSGILTWFVTSILAIQLLSNFKTEKGKRKFLLATYFLWFIPFLSVRFSSENFAAIFLLASLIVFFRISPNSKSYVNYVWVGILLGLSFFFRFQMGFALLGIAAWLLFIRQLAFRSILIIAIGGVLSIAFGTLVDRWFYGEWVCTPYQYFFANIIQNKAAKFGTEPIWYYFNSFFISAIPPISILLFIFLCIGSKNNKKDIFLWILIPFVLAHSLVAHKEMRFLFPLIFGFIYLSALGLDSIYHQSKHLKWWKLFLRLVLIINIPILCIRCLMPANESVAYYRYMYNQYNEKPITILSREKELYFLKTNFYKTPGVHSLQLENDTAIRAFLLEKNPKSILLFESELKNGTIQYPGYKRELNFCLFPQWILDNNLNNWQSRSRIWSIWELKRIED